MLTFRLTAAAFMVVLLGSGVVDAATIATGSVRLFDGDQVTCSAANPGSKTISEVRIVIRFNRSDGSSSSAANGACLDVAEGEVCTLNSLQTGNDFSAFCTVRSNGKMRATLCNTTRGYCTDAR